jgi:hypothetical protein
VDPEKLALRGGIELLDVRAQAEELRAPGKEGREVLAKHCTPGRGIEGTMQTL